MTRVVLDGNEDRSLQAMVQNEDISVQFGKQASQKHNPMRGMPTCTVRG